MLFHADLQGNRQHALKYARRGEDDHHAKLLQAAQDCQSANSGINDANRLLFIHDVSSSAIAQKKA